MPVRPQTQDEETPGMTPLSRSYKPQIQSTMSQLANRPKRYTEIRPTEETPPGQPDIYTASGPSPSLAGYRPDEATSQRLLDALSRAPEASPQRPPFDVTNMGQATGISAAKPWDLFQGERQDAIVGNPRAALARFIANAFPKMYSRIEADPRVWNMEVINRRHPLGPMSEGAAGVTREPINKIPGVIGVNEGVWNGILRGAPWARNIKELPSGEIVQTTRGTPLHTVAHELQHAVRYAATPGKGLPAPKATGERLQELLQRVGEEPFAKQYTNAGASPNWAAREGITEAGSKSATRAARYGGRGSKWEQGIQAAKQAIGEGNK